MVSYHPTKELLIQCVVDLMREQPESSITSDQVLQVSGISKGSMYHHFKDFPELIESANAYLFTIRVNDGIAKMKTAISISKNKSDFLNAISVLSHGNQETTMISARLNHVSSLARAVSSEHMRDLIAYEQQRYTDAMTDVVREAQERGWLNPDCDAQVVATFFIALSVGRAVDYISDLPLPNDEWTFLVDRVLNEVVFNQ